MAASGINEHKEGCRKQRVLDKAANARRKMMDGLADKGDLAPMPVVMDDPEAPGYMRKMGSPPGIHGCGVPGTDNMDAQMASAEAFSSHSPTAIDRQRRERVMAQQLVAYSAKIPNRLSSVMYKQQW